MRILQKSIAKTALPKASFFVAFCAICLAVLTSCGDLLAGDPAADGARFNRHFHYYYKQNCRADAFGAYDCNLTEVLSPSMTVSLRIDSDGLAKLTLDGDSYYYLESEYSEGYDTYYGSYYHFVQDDDELTVYKDGLTLAYWDNFNSTVTYYYYSLYD